MPRIRTTVGTLFMAGGCFGVAIAPMFPFYISERLLQAPVDQHSVTTLTGSGAKYFDIGKLKVIENADVVVTSTLRGVPSASNDTTAVWDYFTVVQDARTGAKLDFHIWRMAFDRKSARLKNCCKAAIDGNSSVRQSGLGVIWPPGDVDRRDYRVFDPNTSKIWTARFSGTEKVSGITAYRYVLQIEPTAVKRLKQLPGGLLGLDEKKKFDVDRVYRGTVTYLVDPRTGVPLDRRQNAVSTLRTLDGVDRITVADLTVRMDRRSLDQSADNSKKKAKKITILRTTGPLTAGALGIVLLAGGITVTRGGRKAPRGQHHLTDEPTPQPARR